MTREEIIKAADNDFEIEAVDMKDELDFYKVYRAGILYGQNHPKSPWISVEDDLPCNHEEMYKMSGSLLYTEEVLVLAGNVLLAGRKLVTCMLFDDNTGKWKWDTPLHVKYWMRIPKSPK